MAGPIIARGALAAAKALAKKKAKDKVKKKVKKASDKMSRKAGKEEAKKMKEIDRDPINRKTRENLLQTYGGKTKKEAKKTVKRQLKEEKEIAKQRKKPAVRRQHKSDVMRDEFDDAKQTAGQKFESDTRSKYRLEKALKLRDKKGTPKYNQGGKVPQIKKPAGTRKKPAPIKGMKPIQGKKGK